MFRPYSKTVISEHVSKKEGWKQINESKIFPCVSKEDFSDLDSFINFDEVKNGLVVILDELDDSGKSHKAGKIIKVDSNKESVDIQMDDASVVKGVSYKKLRKVN
jgi:hypothetical protein